MVLELGAIVAKLPNSGFISYLGSYGLESISQYDEHVAKTATKHGIESLEFDLKQQQIYRDDIKQAIDQHKSTLILLCGRAGDGKTHFLRKLFTDHEFLGGSLEDWNQSSNCFEFTKITNQGPIKFTLVKDFTSNDTESDQKKLLNAISSIFAQNQTQAHGDSCRIVIIAGNNGKILERFQSFYGDQREVNSFIQALESYMLEHDSSQIDKFPGVQCHDMSACLGAQEIATIYANILGDRRWQNCDHCDYQKHCPIMRNRTVLQSPLVLTRLLQIHELLVDNGLHFTIRNVLLLIVNALLGREHDSKYLTCKIVSLNLNKLQNKIDEINTNADITKQQARINHIIMQSPLASNPYNNLFGINFITATSRCGRKKSEHIDQASTINADSMPIFHYLETLGLGCFSTKLSDEFLILGYNNEVFPKAFTKYYQELKSKFDHYDLFATLEKCYEQIQSDDETSSDDETFDKMQTTLTSLRRMLFFVLPDANSDDLYKEEITEAKQNCLTRHGSTGIAECDFAANAGNTKPFFDPFLLTSYPFALKYLKLKHDALLNAQQNNNGINVRSCTTFTSFNCAQQLIVGLNRAFTSLMLVTDADRNILITTNNKINPQESSVLYDRTNYRVNVDYDGYNQDNTLHFKQRGANLSLVFHARKIPTIRLSDGSIRKGLEAKRCYLDLTPKLFEYLMALAAGTAGLSFSQENSNDLAAFKASIDAAITDQIRCNYQGGQQPSFAQLFANIQICKLDNNGGLI